MKTLFSKTILLLLMISCKKPVDKSRTKYGHLTDPRWTQSSLFAAQASNDKITISVCDKTGEYKFGDKVVDALDLWTSGYSDVFSLIMSCSGENILLLQTPTDCFYPSSIAETSPDDLTIPSPGKTARWTISFCKPKKSDFAVILHETGHLVGQCDRYREKSDDKLYHPAMGVNCATSPTQSNGKFDVPSAMQAPGPAHPCKVTTDDFAGVNAFVARRDVTLAEPMQKLKDAPHSQTALAASPAKVYRPCSQRTLDSR